jgi:serine/threonine protein kinase
MTSAFGSNRFDSSPVFSGGSVVELEPADQHKSQTVVMNLQQRLQVVFAESYEIEREIGRGGSSTVYLARDLKHDRCVALKVLHPEFGCAVAADAFLREVQTTAQLQHPHILTLLDSGEVDGLLYFVTPYVEGETLRERLMWEKQLPVEDAVQICREVADALAYAHSQGMVHRDIKPENILLSGDHAVVADFGLARSVGGVGEDLGDGTATVAVGTPAYMSPEQAAGNADVDGRSDIYSLGCVLYEMLAGHSPFSGASPETVLKLQQTAEVQPITDHRPGLPAEVVGVLERALAKTPADRFARAQDMLAMLPFPSDIRPALVRSVAPVSERRWLVAPVFGFAAAAVLLLGLFVVSGAPMLRFLGDLFPLSSVSEASHSVAVLPFANISDEKGNDLFTVGVHEDVLTHLSKIGGLRVISRTSVMPYGSTELRLREIAAELGVTAILEGSVRRVGDRVRITAQLIDARTDRHLWAETYDRELTASNVFSVQTDVAEKIARALHATLATPQRFQHGDGSAEDLQSRSHFLVGS